MKLGCRSSALAVASLSALGLSRRKITHTSTSLWVMPVRSSAPIALRYSVSIRACAHTNPIRQTVLTVTWSEKDGAGVHTFAFLMRSKLWVGAEDAGRAVVNLSRFMGPNRPQAAMRRDSSLAISIGMVVIQFCPTH